MVTTRAQAIIFANMTDIQVILATIFSLPVDSVEEKGLIAAGVSSAADWYLLSDTEIGRFDYIDDSLGTPVTKSLSPVQRT